MITWTKAFTIEKPTKKQRQLLAQPIIVRDLFGQAWSIQPDTKAHLVFVCWLTLGGHNDVVVPVNVCRWPDDQTYWADLWQAAESIPVVNATAPVSIQYLTNVPHWMLLYDWSKEFYTERFNEWKRGLSPSERKAKRKPRAAKAARKQNPFAKKPAAKENPAEAAARASSRQSDGEPQPPRVNPWA
jgi:hypothetical protein